ncbi:MAG: hypothetical protein SO231_10745 [Phocaeicola vulgatus]|nr:hypothetical protein [Phocaeicola vulgatus]
MFGQQRLTALNGVVYLDKIRFSEEKSGFVWTKFITFTEVCEYCRKLYFQFKYPPLWEDLNDYIHWDATACMSGVRSILPNSILSSLNTPGTGR